MRTKSERKFDPGNQTFRSGVGTSTRMISCLSWCEVVGILCGTEMFQVAGRCEISSWILLWMKGYSVMLSVKNFQKTVYFTLCLSLSRVFYNIKKQYKRNILTFTLDIFMRKPKLNKVQNNLRSDCFTHPWRGLPSPRVEIQVYLNI